MTTHTVAGKVAVAMLGASLMAAPGLALSQVELSMSAWVPASHLLVRDGMMPWDQEVEKVTQGRVKMQHLHPHHVQQRRAAIGGRDRVAIVEIEGQYAKRISAPPIFRQPLSDVPEHHQSVAEVGAACRTVRQDVPIAPDLSRRARSGFTVRVQVQVDNHRRRAPFPRRGPVRQLVRRDDDMDTLSVVPRRPVSPPCFEAYIAESARCIN